MPRVQSRTKSTRGAPYVCSTCGEPIKPGQEFYYWSFRYGGTRRIHVTHGRPRRSQLTQSAMGEVYAAVESLEDLMNGDWEFADVEGAVEDLKSTVEEVKTQYEEAAEHFGNAGTNQERAEELEPFMDALEQIDLDDFEEEDPDDEDEVKRDTKPCVTCNGNGYLYEPPPPPTVAHVDAGPVSRLAEKTPCVDCDATGHRALPEDEEVEQEKEQTLAERRQEWRDEIESSVNDVLSEAP